MLIRYPNGVEASGAVIDLHPPERIVFTYGYASGAPIPAGGSRVTIRLDKHPAGTLLQLTHEFADAKVRDEHVQGWRYQLSLFANTVANTVNASASALVDCWFSAWSDADAATRERTFGEITAGNVRFRDRVQLRGRRR